MCCAASASTTDATANVTTRASTARALIRSRTACTRARYRRVGARCVLPANDPQIIPADDEESSGRRTLVASRLERLRPSVARFNPMRLTAGRWAAADGEVVIDKSAAASTG